MEFENAEIKGLKKRDKENEDKIKELEDKLLYQEVYNRIENLLPVPIARIEFQRAHRIGRKKMGEAM